jgi:hypothetical protein
MAVRVSIDEVKNVIATALGDSDIGALIITANAIVDGRLLDKELTEAMLKQIEQYVAAHLIALRDPREKSVSSDGVSVSYDTGKAGEGLSATTWGQMAIMLDTSGTLAEQGMGAKPRVQLRVF